MAELSTCEGEIKDAITASLDPPPQPDPTPSQPENTIYNFNVILNLLDS
ncbi:hypothetical protein NOS3756_27280 [Nostoc sp. NIES-3756]|nr:hypothetical protein [Nostoc sp. NIES-3756]BAT53765.1 hypothetical protein NOS3756_27280 [Nostoc sp. NIES-3756]